MARSRSPAEKKVHRSWIFTINNYTEEDIEWVNGLEVMKITAAKEEGEEGTPHIQGALTMKRGYRLAQLKKLHPKAHWEPATASQDFNYCKKLNSVVIRDEDNKKQGFRTDLERIRNELKQGASLKDISGSCQSLQELTFAEKYLKYNEEHLPKGTKISVYWYYGNTGTGKTKAVLDNHSPYIPINFKWWEGYEGQDVVLLDDLRPDWCKPADLLRLLDPYRFQYRVEVKGSSRPLVATKIFVTTPWHPADFWKDCPEDPKQLMRRLQELIHFREDGQWVKPTGS
jgi:hypothetical protein